MNIAGVIKDWALIFFSFHLFHAPVTRLNLLGYVFCCSGVVVYNHMKLAGMKVAAAKAASAAAGGGGGKDEERGGGPRSRDDILGEIRRLQDEMGRLESKAGFGGGGGGGGSNGVVSAAAAAKTA
jgi:hypothetical protein